MGCLAFFGSDSSISLAMEITITILTIGINTVVVGGVLGGAWMKHLSEGTLFSWKRANTSTAALILEVASGITAIMGLGSMMHVGALGLCQSMRVTEEGVVLGVTFAGILGEGPFALLQGRLFGKLLVALIKKHCQNMPEEEVPETSETLEPTNIVSILLCAGGSSASTFSGLNGYSLAFKAPSAVVS